jgi:hypothetical protein
MVGEAVFGSSVDFENQRSFIPGVGQRASPPTIPGSDGRFLRSHERYRQEYRKGVYLVRHCADVALSYYHWLRWKGVPDMGFKEFLRLLLSSGVDGYGAWPKHVRTWLEAENADVLIVRYEDLRESPAVALGDVMKHIGCQVSDQAIQSAIEQNTLEQMRQKEARARATVFKSRNGGGRFVRSGRTGESRNLLDREDLALIERLAGDVLDRMGYSLSPGVHDKEWPARGPQPRISEESGFPDAPVLNTQDPK